ncbi:MAG TPA: hypothetical protein PLP33_07055 [Leptospiraceae bacterium]|nr:hypothetical protein [Leptospiraceae bacterium]
MKLNFVKEMQHSECINGKNETCHFRVYESSVTKSRIIGLLPATGNNDECISNIYQKHFGIPYAGLLIYNPKFLFFVKNGKLVITCYVQDGKIFIRNSNKGPNFVKFLNSIRLDQNRFLTENGILELEIDEAFSLREDLGIIDHEFVLINEMGIQYKFETYEVENKVYIKE